MREGIDLPMLWPIDDIYCRGIDCGSEGICGDRNFPRCFAVCKQPVLEDNVMTTWRKVLLIDAVQDPGNIGTMIRTADLCRFRCCNFRKRLCRSL